MVVWQKIQFLVFIFNFLYSVFLSFKIWKCKMLENYILLSILSLIFLLYFSLHVCSVTGNCWQPYRNLSDNLRLVAIRGVGEGRKWKSKENCKNTFYNFQNFYKQEQVTKQKWADKLYLNNFHFYHIQNFSYLNFQQYQSVIKILQHYTFTFGKSNTLL